MKTIDKIRDFIAKGETEKAVELLVQYTREQKPTLQNDAVLLSSRYQQWKRNVTIGISESSNDLRHIENNILTLLENSSSVSSPIQKTTTATPQHIPATTSPQQSSNLMPIVIGLLGLGALIMMGFWMFGSDHADDKTQAEKTTTTVVKPAPNNTNTNTKPKDSKPTTKPIDTKLIDTKTLASAKDKIVTKIPDNIINNNVIQQPLTKKLLKVNGRNVNLIEVGFGFYYRHIGNKKWLETNKKTFKNKNHFVETKRDDNIVYLYDKAREVKMQIDLPRKMMTYADRNTKKRDQYRIVKAMVKAKGKQVIRVEYAKGYFELKEGKTWEEKAKGTNKLVDSFKETSRDEWSVYLTNKYKNIQLDLKLKQVFYSPKGKTLTPLYNITASY